jgi:DNA-directed RNA polymerase subunit RPC12/RpoP
MENKEIVCPSCNSTDIQVSEKEVIVSDKGGGCVFGFINSFKAAEVHKGKTYDCRNCGRDFR